MDHSKTNPENPEQQKLKLLLEILALLKSRLPEKPDTLNEKALQEDLIKREAARLMLGISHKTFSRHIDGRLLKPVCLLGARKMYSKKEVLELLAGRGGRNYRHM